MFSRRKIVVKPEYQIRLALTFFIYIIIYSGILGFIIFYPLYSALGSSVSIEEQTRISSMVLYLHKRVWIGFILVAALAAVHAIFSSHRVVGPMYRFEKMVETLKGGDYRMRIRIRKRDEFKEMEGLLNELAHTLEMKESRNLQFYADMRNRLETISAMLEAEGREYPEDVRRLTQGLIAELNARGVNR